MKDAIQMKFEDTIKRLSALVAGLIVFFIAAGMYLTAKGFVMGQNGRMILVNPAEAKTQVTAVPNQHNGVKTNFILPKNHLLGKENAPIKIYEYSSFTCSHCSDFHLDILPQLNKEYIKTGKVNLTFSDFPLDRKSLRASVVARCVPDKKYFGFVRLLFKKQKEWMFADDYEKKLSAYASLNGAKDLEACIKDENITNNIMEDRQRAIDILRISGTPSLLIVDGENKEVLHGIGSYSELKQILDAKLAKAEQK